MIDMDEVISMAIKRAEEEGIIFLMKLIKLRAKKDRDRCIQRRVQRDILPIVEGSTVVTKYGPVKTDHILLSRQELSTYQNPD